MKNKILDGSIDRNWELIFIFLMSGIKILIVQVNYFFQKMAVPVVGAQNNVVLASSAFEIIVLTT